MNTDKTIKELNLDRLNFAPKRRGGIMVVFNDDPELYHLLDQYRRSLGWTWKRMILVGFANTVAKQNDNPDLVVRIANYLTQRR